MRDKFLFLLMLLFFIGCTKVPASNPLSEVSNSPQSASSSFSEAFSSRNPLHSSDASSVDDELDVAQPPTSDVSSAEANESVSGIESQDFPTESQISSAPSSSASAVSSSEIPAENSRDTSPDFVIWRDALIKERNVKDLPAWQTDIFNFSQEIKKNLSKESYGGISFQYVLFEDKRSPAQNIALNVGLEIFTVGNAQEISQLIERLLPQYSKNGVIDIQYVSVKYNLKQLESLERSLEKQPFYNDGTINGMVVASGCVNVTLTHDSKAFDDFIQKHPYGDAVKKAAYSSDTPAPHDT